MKKLGLALLLLSTLLAGCVAYEPMPQSQRGYSGERDRDRDGVPNRYYRDRDGDGVRNERDRRPNDPNRY